MLGRLAAAATFWLMLAAGAAVLIPCVLLPAWFEYRVAVEEHAAYQRLVEDRRHRDERVVKQIEHQQNDPAYFERQMQREFGKTPSGLQVVMIEPDAAAREAEQPQPPAPAAPDDGLVNAQVAAWIERTLDEYPVTQLFLHDQTRPLLMAMGGALIIAAIVLLGRPPGRRAVVSTG